MMKLVSKRTFIAAMLGGATAMSAMAASITNDLVVHLPFDNNYANSVTNAVKASPVGQPSFSPGKVGSHALGFSSADGKFNYVTLGTPPELSFGGNTDFTVAFWIKFSDWGSNPAFVANKDWVGIGPPGWVIATSAAGGLVWNLSETDGITTRYTGSAATIENGQWHHVGVTFDRDGVATAYLEGMAANETRIGPGAPSIDTPAGLATNIGQDGTGHNPFTSIRDGVIDDIGIWRRALSAAEVKQIYDAGLKGQNLLTVGAAPVITIPPSITGITLSPTEATISWTNTLGAATLQKKVALSDAAWLNVATNSNQKATVSRDNQGAFFRVVAVQ